MSGKAVKVEKVTALHDKFAGAKGAILSDYRGLDVAQMAELRVRLREVAVELQVVKNTLARRAVENTDYAPLTDHFAGPTSVAFAADDVVAMAKALTAYARRQPKLEIRAGLVEGKVVSSKDISALAELPPREVLLAWVMGGLQSPVAGFVGVLHGVLRQLLYALLAIKQAKEGESGA
ncbi:MAG: 50S ribosomal protein L10 [bacterium]|nr:50S ribosomal protein L10 [bacterium]